jgi:hypothetical protein
LIIHAWIAYKRQKNERKKQNKSSGKKNLYPLTTCHLIAEKKKSTKNKRITTFCPNFCPLDTIQVKTRVIDDQIFQILFQTTTSQLHTKNTHTTTKKSSTS